MQFKPLPEHQSLSQNVGNWDVDCKIFMEPGKPPMEFKGRDVVTAVGPYFIQGHFTADFNGAPYEGKSTVGFDPKLGKFFSTWIDAMGPTMSQFQGERNEDGVLRFKGTHDAMFGPGSRFESEEVTLSPDHRTFRMWVRLPDGKELPMLDYSYRRTAS